MNWLACLIVVALLGATRPAVAQDLYRTPAIWRDELSRPVALESLRGRSSVLAMGYGACRRICSTTMRILENVQSLADQRGVAVDFVVIGLDPVEDTPADWAAFRKDRGLARANWHFLSGDAAATNAMVQRLGINVWRVDSHLLHDFRIVLLSPEGQVVRSMDHFDEPLSLLLP
jgi:cytochrome oxidase Cu insertion factor (SCO1/SenC/PrrC family)